MTCLRRVLAMTGCALTLLPAALGCARESNGSAPRRSTADSVEPVTPAASCFPLGSSQTWADATAGVLCQRPDDSAVAELGCQGYDVLATSGHFFRETRYFDASTHVLVGVSGAGCTAGPWCRGTMPTLTRPCRETMVLCGHPNAGVVDLPPLP